MKSGEIKIGDCVSFRYFLRGKPTEPIEGSGYVQLIGASKDWFYVSPFPWGDRDWEMIELREIVSVHRGDQSS